MKRRDKPTSLADCGSRNYDSSAMSNFTILSLPSKIIRGFAHVAQLAEQLIRNEQVISSSLIVGSFS